MGPMPIQSPYWGNNAGVVTAIAVDPTDASTVYAGTVGGGVWKSTNSGATWKPISDLAPSLAIGSLAIDPSNHLIVYAGTGAANDGGRQFGAGVLKSLDGGASWSVVGNADGSFYGRTIHQVVIVPQNPSVLYATTEIGIFKSVNGGASWSSIYAFLPPNVYDSVGIGEVVVDPVNPATVMAAVYYAPSTAQVSGILRSIDGGSTWTMVTAGLPASGSANRISLTISPSNHLRLYAAMGGSAVCTLGVFRSDDGGLTWIKLTSPDIFAISIPGFYYCQGWYDNYIAADPTNPDIAYVGGIDVWKITGAGAAFTNLTNSYGSIPPIHVHPDQHSLGFASNASGSSFYIGNDGGIWSTANGGASFTNLNATLETSLMYHGVAQSPSLALAGLQDNGVVETTGAVGWRQVYGGDGSAVAIDFNTPSTMYMSAYSPLYVYKSTNGGASWAAAQNGINPADQPGVEWQPMIMDPNSSVTLLAGANTGTIYRTSNGAASWSSIGKPYPSLTTALAVAPSNSQEIWVGDYAGKIFTTTNLGATWVEHDPYAPYQSARGIAVDPANPQHAFVSFGTDFAVPFPGFTNGAVFETSDLGATWTEITGPFASIPVESLAVDHAGTLYAGTDFGVFARVHGTWGLAGNGLPAVRVNQLVLSRDESKLYAATYGRGMWALTPVALQLPGAPSGVTASVGDGEATLTWTPLASASPITGYTVTASPGGAMTTVNAVVPAATVTGLTNGTPYTFTVAAVNAVGTGPASLPSSAVTPTAVAQGPSVAVLPAMSNGAYGGYLTTAYLENLGASAAHIRVQYFNTSGSGVGRGNSVAGLPPGATWTLRTDNGDSLGATQPGSAVVYSDQPLAVFVNEFAPGNASDATSYTAISVPSGTGGTLFAPAIANNAYGGYTTGIGLVNLSASAVAITVTYRDSSGAVIQTQTLPNVAGGAYQGLYSGDATLGLPAGFAGTATIMSSGGNLAAVVNETGPGNQFSSYDAVPAGSSTLYAPVALNNAFGGYNTGMGIQNTTGTAGTVTINYYDATGTATTKTFPIVANGYLGVYQGTDIPVAGAYTAKLTSTVAIAAIVNEVAPSPTAAKQSTAYNTFAAGSSSLHLPLVGSAGPDGWSTGEGIMNTGTAATAVTATYYDTATGVQVGTPQSLSLQPNAFWGLYQPAGGLPNGMRASAIVTTAAGGQVAVICNESNATSFMSYSGI